MKYEVTVRVRAPVARVWETIADIERWPQWTASVRRVEPVTPGPLAPGARYRIRQPWLAPLVWEVTHVDPGRSFGWTARAPGLETKAEHWIEPGGAGAVEVSLLIEQSGWLAPVLGRLLAPLTHRYMRLEAEGLRERCEAESSAA